MKNSIVYIENSEYTIVKKVLRQWIELYTDALDQKDTFTLYQADNQLTVIQLNQEMDNEHFNYLVNYLTYPEGLEDRLEVNGYTRIKDKSLFPGQQLDEIVLIYVPQDDTQFDIVHGMVKSGKTFKIDFGGKSEVVSSNKSFSVPNSSYRDFPSETLGVEKKRIDHQKSDHSLKRFNRRFNVIAPVYLAGIMVTGYFVYGSEDFLTVVKVASFGLLFWIILEHDLLRFDSIYIKLFAIALFLAVMGHYAAIDYPDNIWMNTTRMGLCFVILYQILRYGYKYLFKREPAFDKHSKYFADKVYSVILGFGSIIASMLI